tara:strand:+ start:689 stop:856 length:168 start_codon:yes stop_codon:yes gene_type:complete
MAELEDVLENNKLLSEQLLLEKRAAENSAKQKSDLENAQTYVIYNIVDYCLKREK